MLLCRVFCFNDAKKGKIQFTGNVLFTHFGEIGEPNKALDLGDSSYVPPGTGRDFSLNASKL